MVKFWSDHSHHALNGTFPEHRAVTVVLFLVIISRAVARALIGGGGGGCIFIYSCSARVISFEINLKTTDFKRNPSGITRIYEYTPPPPPPINALATALIISES